MFGKTHLGTESEALLVLDLECEGLFEVPKRDYKMLHLFWKITSVNFVFCPFFFFLFFFFWVVSKAAMTQSSTNLPCFLGLRDALVGLTWMMDPWYHSI